ncbi:MAG: 2-C-methyl-D-erythritol 4-phosphate cytidylyltransferase [Desulfobacterales bacterium]
MACAVIVAAGRGKRMNLPVAKQFLEIGGKPLFVRTLAVFAVHPRISRIQLVVPQEDVDFCKSRISDELAGKSDIGVTAGGKKRQDSVYQGLLALKDPAEKIVLIHDGVRPFVTPELISACIDGAAEIGACIAAIPASDTLKRVDSGNRITETLPRDSIWLAQTPQAFSLDLIKSAYEKAMAEGFSGTDDASLVERTGRQVKIIEGSLFNIKITAPGDLEIAEQISSILKIPTGNMEVSNVR